MSENLECLVNDFEEQLIKLVLLSQQAIVSGKVADFATAMKALHRYQNSMSKIICSKSFNAKLVQQTKLPLATKTILTDPPKKKKPGVRSSPPKVSKLGARVPIGGGWIHYGQGQSRK